MKHRIIVLLAMPFLLAGCGSTQPVRVDPTVVSTSYDYTKPADIAAQSRPVWVLPIINKGWIPARVDPRSGDWVSGHYQATIVQDGYWATQEEAELSGRPYILAGDSTPIIPAPVGDGPTAKGGGGAELQMATMQKRIDHLETKNNNQPNADPDQLAALSAQVQSLSQNVPATYGSVSSGEQNVAGYAPNVFVSGTQVPMQDRSAVPSATGRGAPAFQGKAPSVILPPMPAGTVYEIPSNPQLPQKMVVHYLEDNQVEIDYMGRRTKVDLERSGSSKVETQRTINLDDDPDKG
ncbi:MAG: hypothetical protein ACOY3I_08585 [Verrucomicrobiota bacterium]